jgi:transcriptional regulator with XRE-family HTH domain
MSCTVYYIVHMTGEFGGYLREVRERHRSEDPAFSLRQLAQRIGVEPSFLSKVERGEVSPPSEAKILLLARELGEDPDMLLALAGKVSSDLQDVIRKRPELFAGLIRDLKEMPDHAVLRIVREVRDGEW